MVRCWLKKGGERKPMKTKYYNFVIDTDSYAGNFERAMCAYITGQVGECGVGKEMAELAKKELSKEQFENFSNIVAFIYDEENGCFRRPCKIYKNPNWFYDKYTDDYKRINESTSSIRFPAYFSDVAPAYFSVAIFLTKRPQSDLDLMILMKERAYKFAEAYRKHSKSEFNRDFKLNIEGFRIVWKPEIIKEEKI